MIDIRLLTFMDLCETLNYSITAKRLFISQPTVSLHIKSLEKDYNTQLFYKQNRLLILTPQGELLCNYARTANANAAMVRSLLSQSSNAQKTHHIGSLLTIGEVIMPRVINDFLILNPTDNFSLIIGDADYLINQLQKGQISLALLDDFYDSSKMASEYFFQDNTICVCGSNHPLANQTVKFDDLYNELLVYREYQSTSMTHFIEILSRYGHNPENFGRQLHLGSFTSSKTYVQKYGGITFAYHFFMAEDLKKGNLAQIFIKDFNPLHIFRFVWNKDSPFSATDQVIIEFCKNNISSLIDRTNWK